MPLILIISLLIFAASIFFALYKKNSIEKSIRIFAVGTFITAVLLLFPLIINHNKSVSNEDSIPVITVVLAALQLSSLDGDYPLWIFEASNISKFYRIFFSIICYCMPLVFGGFIISFFEGILLKVKYIILRPFKDIFYLSELNNKSLSLAQSIKKQNKKSLIIFYNCNSENNLKDDAYAEGFLVFGFDIDKLIYRNSKNIHLFMIKENQEANLPEGLKVINLYKSLYCENLEKITISIFSETKDSEVILNSTDKAGIQIRLINTPSRIANDLFFNYPLYNVPAWKNKKSISILIIGAGDLGFSIIKNSVWCSQFGNDYSFKINVIDKDADYKKELLKHQCSEFFNPMWNYNINFYNSDIDSIEFEEVLKANCADADYITVCLDNDEKAIDTALFLRRFYISQDSSFTNEPFIFVRIRDHFKNESIKELTAVNREKISLKGWGIYSSKSENYNITPFGEDNSIYNYDSLVNNPLDKISINVHSAYQHMFNDTEVPQEEILKTYNYNEIDKRSNIANALHIKYKLKLLGYEIKPLSEATEEEKAHSKNYVEEFKQKTKEPETITYLGILEHNRWLSFMVSEGWRRATIDQAKVYSKTTGSHKHSRAKLHACICTWEELDVFIQHFDEHIKDYDTEMVTNIPYILGMEESSINVTGIKYILVKSEEK